MTTTTAHRMVMARVLGRNLGQDEIVDHIDFNKLNNRRSNLRIVTRAMNSQHRQALGSTGLRGVTLHRGTGKWQAAVSHLGKSYYCGLFSSAEEAGKAAHAMRDRLGFLGGAA
jgi:hypothetical protein